MAVITKPKSIKLFNRLNLAATLVGIANIFAHYTLLRSLAISNGGSAVGPILGIIYLLISYVIFWVFIYRRGSNIAKWLFVAGTVISVVTVPLNLRKVIAVGLTYAGTDCLAFILQITAAAMLFRSDAKAWLIQKKAFAKLSREHLSGWKSVALTCRYPAYPSALPQTAIIPEPVKRKPRFA